MKFVQTHSDGHNTHLSYKLNPPPVFTSHAFQMYLLGTLKQCMLGRIIMLTCSRAILTVPSKHLHLYYHESIGLLLITAAGCITPF